MISTLELTKAGSQKEGSHYGATKGSDATEGRWGAGYLARWESALRRAQPGRWADPLGDAIKAARAWCRGGADAAEKEPLVAVTVDRSASRDDDAEG